VDLVLTQDFFPRFGGAHMWLYEVYRRWPTPVTLLTRSYDDTPADVEAQARFDAKDHGSLRIVRADMTVDDINLMSGASRQRFGNSVRQVRAIAGKKPVTLHVLRAFPEGFTALLAKLRSPWKTRVIVYAHGEETLVARASGQLRIIAQLVYRFADLVIVNSRSTEALVKGLCPSAKTVCIHPGVDAARFRASGADVDALRAQWGWPQDTVIVSTVSRMEPRKNQVSVLNAVAALRAKGLPLAYVCAGGGEERPKLEALTRTLGIEPWVRFTGTVTDEQKVLIYAASDLYAMPSIRSGEMIEGFGIVFVEAAAAGIPSICGNIGGQPEAVIDGQTGFVVDGNDAAAVQGAMERLATNRSLREQMGAAGLMHAASLDWHDVTAATVRAVGGRA
jgi:phosphatidyl-myo-inositol dimannoside synthase